MGVYQSQYTGAEHDAYVTKQALVDLIYPVGAIYMSVNSTSPATLFGGTWQAIEGKFLVGADNTFTAGNTGGNDKHTHTYAHTHTTPATTTDSHTLTVTEMPTHKHNFRTYYKDSYNIADGPTIFGCYGGSGSQASLSAYNAYSGSQFTMTMLDTGGGGGHTHGQVATTTDSQSATTTDSSSNLPPYLSVYIWKRTA